MATPLVVFASLLSACLYRTANCIHVGDEEASKQAGKIGAQAGRIAPEVPRQLAGLEERLQFSFYSIIGRDDEDDGIDEAAFVAKGPQHRCKGRLPLAQQAPFNCSLDRRAPCKLDSDTVDRGCERHQSSCDKSLYENSSMTTGLRMPCCEKRNLFSILDFVDTVLCDKVEYGLMSESLLAAVRTGDFSDWDADLDIVIDIVDQERAIELLRNAAGNFSVPETNDTDVLHVSWGAVNGVHAKISWAHHVSNCTKINGEVFPRFWFPRPFRGQCQIQGRIFPCPNHGEKVLDYLFGNKSSTDDRPHGSWRDEMSLGGRAMAGGRASNVCKDVRSCSSDVNGFSCALPAKVYAGEQEPGELRAMTPLDQVRSMPGRAQCLILLITLTSVGLVMCFCRSCMARMCCI